MRSLVLAAICVFFISPASARDVYFCNTLENIEIESGKLTKHQLQNFKMQVTQSMITLTGDNYFNGAKFDIKWWRDETFWNASGSSNAGHIAFEEPLFHFAFVSFDHVKAIAARCDKF